MSQFTYADFQLFVKATQADEHTYITVIKGVMEYVKSAYGIYPEAEDATFTIRLSTNETNFYIPAEPVNSITSIVYDGVTYVADEDFTWYGEDVELTNTLPAYRKPLTVTANVGYTTIPHDLKLAIYRHAEAVFYAIQQHTDNVEKTINTGGNTTYYLADSVPPAVAQVYRQYAGRPQAIFYV